MRFIFALSLISSFVHTSSRIINYCGSRMCGNTNAHTLCQYPEGPGPKCTGYIESRLSREEKSRIMARLNRRRNEAASGRLRGMPSAGNMLKLRWVEELAREAQRWADQCHLPRTPEDHDACRDLYSITVGQCVASVVGEAPGLRVESMVDMWYMQSMYYKGNLTSYLPPEKKKRYYGDFGQIMWARSYMIGCGRSRFMSAWQGRLRSVERLVCNVAPRGAAPTHALWAPAPPASLCPPRSQPDTTFAALCDYQHGMDESSDVYNLMTLEEHVLLNSVLELEKNESFYYHGSLDESYLTNLAIMTMQSTVATPSFYNSIQKRDVVDLSEIEEKIDSDKVVKVITQDLNKTVPLVTKLTKKKVSLVGRPKSYNMEELTEVGGDHREDNDDTEIEVMLKHKRDFYAEYSLLEVEEDGGTMTVESTIKPIASGPYKIEIENLNDEVMMKDNSFTESTSIEEIYTENSNKLNETTTSVVYNTGTVRTDELINDKEMSLNMSVGMTNSSSTLEEKTVEEYLADPETARELQEALDRMEATLEPSKPPGTQGKVRRDLREYPPGLDGKIKESTSGQRSLSVEEERNKTIERGPMINMVLRYMPYLQRYENDILGNPASNRAISVSPSAILWLTFCL